MLYALCIVNVTSYMGACMMPFLYTFQVGLLLVPLKDVEPPDTISVLAITIPLGFIFLLNQYATLSFSIPPAVSQAVIIIKWTLLFIWRLEISFFDMIFGVEFSP